MTESLSVQLRRRKKSENSNLLTKAELIFLILNFSACGSGPAEWVTNQFLMGKCFLLPRSSNGSLISIGCSGCYFSGCNGCSSGYCSSGHQAFQD